MRDYVHRLQTAIIQAEAETELSKERQADLAAWKQKVKTMQETLRSHTQTKSQFGFGQDRANCSLAWSDWQPLRQPARSGGG